MDMIYIVYEEYQLKTDKWKLNRKIKNLKRSRFMKPDNISNLNWYCLLIEEEIRYKSVIQDINLEI